MKKSSKQFLSEAKVAEEESKKPKKQAKKGNT